MLLECVVFQLNPQNHSIVNVLLEGRSNMVIHVRRVYNNQHPLSLLFLCVLLFCFFGGPIINLE